MSEHKMSSFLTNFVRREKELPKTTPTEMPTADDLGNTLARLRDDALQVHHEYRGSTQDLETRIGRISTQLASLYPVVNAVHRAYAESSARATALEREVDALKKNLHTSTEDLADHKTRLAERVRQMEAMVEEREQLRGDVERFEKEAEELRRVRETLEFELNASKRRAQELDKRVIELEDEKTQRDNAYFEAKRTVARLTNDLGETKLSLEARSTAHDEIKAMLATEQANRAKLSSDFTRTSNECQSLRSQLGHLEKEQAASRKRYEAQIERMAVSATIVERDRDAARGRLDVTTKINGAMRRKIERAHQHIGYLQATLRRLMEHTNFERVPDIDLDYDFDQNDAQLVAPEVTVDTATETPEAQPQEPPENFEDESSVIKLPARRRK